MMLSVVKRLIIQALEKSGYLLIKVNSKKSSVERQGCNLNVGSGRYVIDGFTSYDLYTEHYHPEGESGFVNFDIRNDRLPLADDTVDNIYISHVIEHIEAHHARRFLGEAFRVLKPRGVLRICCPDAEFLFDVSQHPNDYWEWRKEWFQRQALRVDDIPDQLDFFIREVATPMSRFYDNQIPAAKEIKDRIKGLGYQDAIRMLNQDLTFRKDHPGDHICGWDFSKLNAIGSELGFSRVFRSKPGGSISKEMQGPDFDLTAPAMSLYVEMLK